MIQRTHKGLLGVALLTGLLLAGCTNSSQQAPGDELAPHRIIAEVIDYEAEPVDIETKYSKEGQDWLRMSFPDMRHREYALKHIGKEAPKVSFTTLKDKEMSLESISDPTILYFTQTDSSITKEMAGYMDTFQQENKGIDVYSLYPADDAKAVESFYEENDLKYDASLIGVGEEVSELVEAFKVEDTPLMVYIDETQTISYTAIGFRDLVFMNDHAESAFGERPFYRFIDVNFEPEAELLS